MRLRKVREVNCGSKTLTENLVSHIMLANEGSQKLFVYSCLIHDLDMSVESWWVGDESYCSVPERATKLDCFQ